ncbi:hypothetical protein [Variovorax sp. dw_308]|uniref:hypothetical protein n=1 Tax=Variovorax sp. dw_308 TaxID=2721546 RepID=UPI001C48DFDA|nr:hypothetical protein [Variovorax sp. dw_308]
MSTATAKPRKAARVAAAAQLIDMEARDFERGRDLAVAMLREGHALWNTDDAAELRRYREGRAQNRFARSSLERLIEEPALLEGFAAVLSAKLGAGEGGYPEAYATLPMAEFEAGELGADGTQVEDSAPTPSTDTDPSQPAPQGPGNIGDAWLPSALLSEAGAVMEMALAGWCSDVAYGAQELTEACRKRLDQAIEAKDCNAVEAESCRIGVALAVMLTVAEDDDDQVCWAVVRLLQYAKKELDDVIERLPPARHYAQPEIDGAHEGGEGPTRREARTCRSGYGMTLEQLQATQAGRTI